MPSQPPAPAQKQRVEAERRNQTCQRWLRFQGWLNVAYFLGYLSIFQTAQKTRTRKTFGNSFLPIAIAGKTSCKKAFKEVVSILTSNLHKQRFWLQRSLIPHILESHSKNCQPTSHHGMSGRVQIPKIFVCMLRKYSSGIWTGSN